jgi:hypothetical protein
MIKNNNQVKIKEDKCCKKMRITIIWETKIITNRMINNNHLKNKPKADHLQQIKKINDRFQLRH